MTTSTLRETTLSPNFLNPQGKQVFDNGSSPVSTADLYGEQADPEKLTSYKDSVAEVLQASTLPRTASLVTVFMPFGDAKRIPCSRAGETIDPSASVFVQ